MLTWLVYEIQKLLICFLRNNHTISLHQPHATSAKTRGQSVDVMSRQIFKCQNEVCGLETNDKPVSCNQRLATGVILLSQGCCVSLSGGKLSNFAKNVCVHLCFAGHKPIIRINHSQNTHHLFYCISLWFFWVLLFFSGCTFSVYSTDSSDMGQNMSSNWNCYLSACVVCGKEE